MFTLPGRDSNSRSLIQPPGLPPLDHNTIHYSIVRFFTYSYCCSERSSRYCCRYPRSILFPLRFSLSSIFPFLCSLVHFPFFVFFPLPFLGFRFIFLSCVSCSWFSFSLVFQRSALSFSFVSFSLFLLLSFCVCLLPLPLPRTYRHLL